MRVLDQDKILKLTIADLLIILARKPNWKRDEVIEESIQHAQRRQKQECCIDRPKDMDAR